jgi:hypothetical protein
MMEFRSSLKTFQLPRLLLDFPVWDWELVVISDVGVLVIAQRAGIEVKDSAATPQPCAEIVVRVSIEVVYVSTVLFSRQTLQDISVDVAPIPTN